MTKRFLTRTVTVALAAGLAATAVLPAQAERTEDPLVAAFQKTDSDTPWTLAGTIDLDFDVFHPQAMEVTEDRIYLSTVEVHEWPERYPEPVDGYDRSPGSGVGHVFVLDHQGNLLHDIEISDGHKYHPGGLDVHGDTLYVPVAEYRPDSAANVYQVDLNTFEVTEMFSVDDHIGGVIYDAGLRRIVGQSWNSDRFYEWTRTGKQKDFWLNPDELINYQDCEYVHYRKQLCSGGPGFALADVKSHEVLHHLPITLTTETGNSLTGNPTDIDTEVTADGTQLTMYGAPDDDLDGKVYIYTADIAN